MLLRRDNDVGWHINKMLRHELYAISDYLDEHCNRHIELLTDDQTFRVNASRQYYYPHDLSCNLTLTAEPNSEHIMFYFKYIDIRADLSCGIDWLEIHDGDSTQSPPVCGIIGLYIGTSESRREKICLWVIHNKTR